MIETRILPITLLFAFIVILMGAYTRLSDAGLGCPDWPGCYGQLTVPQTESELIAAQAAHPESMPVAKEKAWSEMTHRYLAGSFGLCVIALSCYLIRQKHYPKTGLTLILLIVFQALLGLWTVTLKLHPVTVMLHLFGGFLTATLLFYMMLNKKKSSPADRWGYTIFGAIILQILLGGWVSSNYAALICPDFPYCQGSLFPPFSLAAFNPFLPLGENYQYGVLDNTARVSIHLAHRYFAILLSLSILGFLFYCFQKKLAPIKHIVTTATLLCIQILMGILNVVLLLPMHAALSHNFFGLLLLLSWLWLLHSLSPYPHKP